eukprot:SAG31_NODE_11626_length_1012_cov_0.707558_2_plen_107_part_01
MSAYACAVSSAMGIDADKVKVNGVRADAGSIVVDFSVVVPESAASSGANLLATVAAAPPSITVGDQELTPDMSETVSSIAVTRQESVNCVGAWTSCSATCRKVYEIS